MAKSKCAKGGSDRHVDVQVDGLRTNKGARASIVRASLEVVEVSSSKFLGSETREALISGLARQGQDL